MNKIMGRARILLILILVLALGTSFFVGEYFIKSGDWILFAGSPHIYNAANIGCGTITDRDGMLLLDMTDGRTYAENVQLRSAIIHWLGDRQGNISAPALSHYAEAIAGFDKINGLYAYGGTGGTVTTTFSAKVQMAALEAMGDYTGTVAVYNYKTGELICAVSTPNFDPDNVPEIAGVPEFEGVYLNRFTQSTYTPGSIFKIVTAAAALETIPDILDRTYTCSGLLEFGEDRVTCERAHGTLTFKEAFARSCNCAFARIANQVGGDVLQRYAQQFKITEAVEFDGIKTAAGSLSAAGEMPVNVAWSGIGQHEDLVNPCRYLAFLGAIANDGVEITPHFVDKITVGGKITYQASDESAGRIMSSHTAQILQEFLRNNVENYYGDDSFPGLKVCAKSGTAEVGGDKKPNAMFTGFVADENLPLAFIVAVEDGGYGRQVCTPIIAKILEACKAELLE
ncbi:MAG: penicillin-binding protein [Oscillospiraceae bacterium]|nr:penicillin-binding protein [Oscillospiraceae bacterium]